MLINILYSKCVSRFYITVLSATISNSEKSGNCYQKSSKVQTAGQMSQIQFFAEIILSGGHLCERHEECYYKKRDIMRGE